MEEEFLIYFNKKKALHNLFLLYLDSDENSLDNKNNLIKFINSQKIQENRVEFEHFLRLLLVLTEHHHRQQNFLDKIEQIISNFSNNIKQNFSFHEIMDIFYNCKQILLILIKNKTIDLNEDFIKVIFREEEPIGTQYTHFLYNELTKCDSDLIAEIDLQTNGTDILINYDENRQKGENESYICSLIRNDSIVEFISYVNKSNIPLDSDIEKSIFETNSILNEKVPTLIEYATFCGSVQIFQYLKINNVKLTPSLWIYAIHSNNAEMINFLEESNVNPPDDSYEKCLEESIKCHHNEIASYFLEQKLENIDISKIYGYCFKYYNYLFLPSNFDYNLVSFYICQYHYDNLVKILVEKENNKLIQNKEIL